MKPMLKYRGGKSREIGEFEPFLPKAYDRYIEPFFGGGALYFHLEPTRAIINDLNAPLMGFYEGVRDQFDVVHDELSCLEDLYVKNRAVFDAEKKKHPDERVYDANEDLYYRLRDEFNGCGLGNYSAATVYYFINKTAYSGMIRYNKDGKYNVPYGRYKNFNTRMVSRAHSQLLQHAALMCGDYSKVFTLSTDKDFMFLDPPYDCIFSDYGNQSTRDGFNEREHRRLAEAYKKLSCKALMVIGKTPLTAELYKGLIVHEYEKRYAVNIRNRFKSAGQHILVANY